VASGFAAQIRALRITVTVRQGRSSFQLNALVAPPNGARPVTPVRVPGATTAAAAGQTGTVAATATPLAELNYPFTLLEITENAAMSVVASAQAGETL
jgi:general secretion pathway protein K